LKRKSAPSDQITRDAILLILAVLAQEPSYGYVIGQTILKRSDNKINLGDATIYPVLKALERDGLITGEWETPVNTGVPRKIFTITNRGRNELVERKTIHSSISLLCDTLLGGGPIGSHA
jgi:PadR family transcriptional regulator PadR